MVTTQRFGGKRSNPNFFKTKHLIRGNCYGYYECELGGQSKVQFGFKMPWLTTKAFLCLQSCMGLHLGHRPGSIFA